MFACLKYNSWFCSHGKDWGWDGGFSGGVSVLEMAGLNFGGFSRFLEIFEWETEILNFYTKFGFVLDRRRCEVMEYCGGLAIFLVV